jgi:hypothetical protein
MAQEFYYEMRFFIQQILDLTPEELELLTNNSFKVSAAADAKVAINQALSAHMTLATMYSGVAGKLEQMKQNYIPNRIKEIRDLIYSYINDLNNGFFPEEDREAVMTVYDSYLKFLSAGDDKDVKALSLGSMTITKTWQTFVKLGISESNIPKFTKLSEKVSTTTQITTATAPRAIETIAKQIATQELQNMTESLTSKAVVLKELMNSIQKTMSSLGDLGSLISSEMYGIKRHSDMEKRA